MERLYAPWRLAYVKRDTKPAQADGCIFCDKPREDHDTENYIVVRAESCFVILNAFPYNNGHLMVVPFRHVSRPAELSDEENAELMTVAAQMTRILDMVYHPHGYNIGMNIGEAGGAGIAAHLHLHIVPRWNGDTNFMPVVADTKVLPELLAQTYEKLKMAVAENKMSGENKMESEPR